MKEAEGAVVAAEKGLDIHINSSLASIRTARTEKLRNNRADNALARSATVKRNLEVIISNMVGTWHGVNNANNDQFDTKWFGNDHAKNKAKLLGRMKTSLEADSVAKVTALLAKLAAFVATVEAEKAKPFVAPTPAPAPAPAPVAGTLTWKAVGSTAATTKDPVSNVTTGQASVEVDGTLPSAGVEVDLVGATTKLSAAVETSTTGKNKITIGFDIPLNNTKTYVLYEKGTTKILRYVTVTADDKGTITVTNSAPAAAPVAGAVGGTAGGAGAPATPPLAWNAGGTVQANATDKGKGTFTVTYTGTAPTTGFEVKNAGGAVVTPAAPDAVGSLTRPYTGLTQGGPNQIFKIREAGKIPVVHEIVLSWPTSAPQPLAITRGPAASIR